MTDENFDFYVLAIDAAGHAKLFAWPRRPDPTVRIPIPTTLSLVPPKDLAVSAPDHLYGEFRQTGISADIAAEQAGASRDAMILVYRHVHKHPARDHEKRARYLGTLSPVFAVVVDKLLAFVAEENSE